MDCRYFKRHIGLFMPTKKPASRSSAVAKKTAATKTPAKKAKAPVAATDKSNKRVLPEDVATANAAEPDVVPTDEEVSRQAIRLSFLLHDVSRMRRAAYDQLMKPFNFTRARWWILAHLSRQDGMMQSQLAELLEVGKASLGSIIEQLETDGWVERRSDPSDKRAKRVYLTRAAQPFIKKMTREEDQFNSVVLAKLSHRDRAEMGRMMSLIKESLQQFAKPADSADD
jgi:MarR family transcriptional regulator for hemolysin